MTPSNCFVSQKNQFTCWATEGETEVSWLISVTRISYLRNPLFYIYTLCTCSSVRNSLVLYIMLCYSFHETLFILSYRRHFHWQRIESSWRLVLWRVKRQWRPNHRAFSYGSETKWRKTLSSQLQWPRPVPGWSLPVLSSIQRSGLFAK